MRRFFLLVLLCGLHACAKQPTLPESAGFGPDPTLPEPRPQLIPIVNIAPARGWERDEAPTPAAGLAVNEFARDLDHPRWIYVLPNGDVLVAETNAPERPEAMTGIKGWFMSRALARAGAAVPSANRITLLRDADGDGVADRREVFLEGLNSPFGIVLVGDELYVANTDALLRFPYQRGATSITAHGTKVVDLPAGPINYHWTKNVIAGEHDSMLYVTVGSNSNVGENGMEEERRRAAILEVDARTGAQRVFASGLRNPIGLAWEPQTGALWTAVNERDELGNDLVPDYITSVQEGGFYGWPYSYYGQHIDERVEPQRPELVESAIVPDYAVGSHTAAMGIVFYQDGLLPERYHGGAFIGLHGSWNRDAPTGYKVIFVPFDDGQPAGAPQDVLTGFLDQQGEARGRPVGVAIDATGAVLVADDVGNRIWRVAPAER